MLIKVNHFILFIAQEFPASYTFFSDGFSIFSHRPHFSMNIHSQKEGFHKGYLHNLPEFVLPNQPLLDP